MYLGTITSTGLINTRAGVPLNIQTGDPGDALSLQGSGGSGNVGIGTTAPAFKLDVVGAARLSGLRYPTSDGSAGQLMGTDGAGGLGFVSVAASPFNTFVSSKGTTDISTTLESTMEGMSVVVNTDGSPIKLSFWAGYQNSSPDAITTFRLKRSGLSILQWAHTLPPVAARSDETSATWVDTPSAGTYTYTVTWTTPVGTSSGGAATNPDENRILTAEFT